MKQGGQKMKKVLRVGCLIVLGMIMFAVIFAGAFVSEQTAANALLEQGYTCIFINDHIWFQPKIIMCGGDKYDLVCFEFIAMNPEQTCLVWRYIFVKWWPFGVTAIKMPQGNMPPWQR